jgi:hypothetical protein
VLGTAGIPEANGELRDRLILANFSHLKPSPLPVLGTAGIPEAGGEPRDRLISANFPQLKTSPLPVSGGGVPPAFQKLATSHAAYFRKLNPTPFLC